MDNVPIVSSPAQSASPEDAEMWMMNRQVASALPAPCCLAILLPTQAILVLTLCFLWQVIDLGLTCIEFDKDAEALAVADLQDKFAPQVRSREESPFQIAHCRGARRRQGTAACVCARTREGGEGGRGGEKEGVRAS